MIDDKGQGGSPSDSEELVGDTAASDSLTDKKGVQPAEIASREQSGALPGDRESSRGHTNGEHPTPRT